MIPEVRQEYNRKFTSDRYISFKRTIAEAYGLEPTFRIAETPVFVPNDLKEKLFQACNDITDIICRPDFRKRSEGAILSGQFVPGETDHTTFLQMDFGICRDENGQLYPQLIEVQGFPSLYFFQDLLAGAFRKHFDYPETYTHLFGGLNSEEYIELLRETIVGDCDPSKVALVEIEPGKQTTQIDFLGATHTLGIPTVCITDLITEGRDVFYKNGSGKPVKIEKILNRVIFDELLLRKDLHRQFSFAKEYDIEWVGHPHWFFRISKHTLPILDSPYVPKSYFLNELDNVPDDLHNYVLKPLYSFAGTGVIINLNQYDLDAIEDRENYILQRKVEYARVVETLSEPAKCEIRMLMLWERGAARPRIVNNLARLSKGEMIGVKYNKNKDWVGASVALFEN